MVAGRQWTQDLIVMATIVITRPSQVASCQAAYQITKVLYRVLKRAKIRLVLTLLLILLLNPDRQKIDLQAPKFFLRSNVTWGNWEECGFWVEWASSCVVTQCLGVIRKQKSSMVAFSLAARILNWKPFMKLLSWDLEMNQTHVNGTSWMEVPSSWTHL